MNDNALRADMKIEITGRAGESRLHTITQGYSADILIALIYAASKVIAGSVCDTDTAEDEVKDELGVAVCDIIRKHKGEEIQA